MAYRQPILIFFLLNSIFLFAQDKASLEHRARKMYDYMVSSQNDSLVAFMHPDAFKDSSREELVKRFQLMNDNERTSTTLLNVPPNFKFGEIKKIGEGYYNIFYYDQMIKVFFKEQVPEKDHQFLVDLYADYLGADKGVFKANQNTIYLEKRVKVIAVADAASSFQWTFFGEVKDRNLREELGL